VRISIKTPLVWMALLLVSSAGANDGGSEVHWSYHGDDGPEHWGELSSEFARCRDGLNQSPVNLEAALDAELPELVFQYHGTPLREINNGHTIMLPVQPGSFLEMPELNERYQLQQGHFHSPSEHTINGEHFDMEIHLVHSGEDGGLVVVGIMINEGEENPKLNQIYAFMPEHPGETKVAPVSVFEAGVLPPTRDYFAYNGSLTTPPCSEGVRWIVLREAMTASAEQVARFKELVGPATNRPVQPINARRILN